MSYKYVGQQDDLIPLKDKDAENERHIRLLARNTIPLKCYIQLVGISYAQDVYYAYSKNDSICLSMTNMNALDFTVPPIIISNDIYCKFLINKHNGHIYLITDLLANNECNYNTVKVFIDNVLYNTCKIILNRPNMKFWGTKFSIYYDTHILFVSDGYIFFAPFSLLYKEKQIDVNHFVKVKIPNYDPNIFYSLCNNYLSVMHDASKYKKTETVFKISSDGLNELHRLEIYKDNEQYIRYLGYFDSNYFVSCTPTGICIFPLSALNPFFDQSMDFMHYVCNGDLCVNSLTGQFINVLSGNDTYLLFISQLRLLDIHPSSSNLFKSIIRINRILNTNNIYKKELMKQIIHTIAGDIPKPVLNEIIKLGSDRKTLGNNLLEYYNKMFEEKKLTN